MKRFLILGWLVFFVFGNIGLNAQTIRIWSTNLPNPQQWSTLANWSPSGSPLNAGLFFNGVGTATESNNDLIGGNYRSLVFSGTRSYTISGNLISLSDNSSQNFGRLINNSNFNQTISAPIIFNEYNNFGVISSSGSSGILVASGGIELGPYITALRLFGDFSASPISISGPIIGNKQITIGLSDSNFLKPNTRVIFQGNNSLFDGAISVQAGTLAVTSPNATGLSNSNAIEIYNNATLEISGGISIGGKDFYIQGSGNNNQGAIRNVSGTNTINSNVIVNGSTRIQCVSAQTLNLGNIGQSGSEPWNLTFAGGIINLNGSVGMINGGNPFGFIQTGGAALTLKQVCNYSGETRVQSGALILGGNNLLPPTSLFHFNGSVSGNLSSGGYSQSFSGLKISGVNNQPTINLTPGINHALTFGNSRNEIWQNAKGIIIYGWTGTAGGPSNLNAGKIFFTPQDASTPGLTENQLAKIKFDGFCEGAKLLPSGELVPSNLPFIRAVSSHPPGGSNNKNFGYVGSEIIINGCRLNEVTQMTIGSTIITPFVFSSVSSLNHNISFQLGENIRGPINLTTASETYTFPQEFNNAGYLTADSGLNWTSNFTWRKPTATPVIPLPNNSVTIGHNSIQISSMANAINSSPSGLNKLIIRSADISGIGAKGSNPALQLAGDHLININTPIEVYNGSLRTFNGNNNANMGGLVGHNQEFGTLQISKGVDPLLSNFNISLGKGSHILKFAPSNQIIWDASSKIFIHNWEGDLGESGTAGQIFFGDSDTTLTNQQLLQIQFVGSTCSGSKILPSGEIVPTNAPFIQSVIGSPGSSYRGYIGSTVTISGCQMAYVTQILVGGVNAPITMQTADEVSFIISANMPNDTIQFKTGDTNINGKSPGVLVNLGYISKMSGIWNSNNTWLGDLIPIAGKNVTINNSVSIVNNIPSSQMPDTLLVTGSGNLIFDAGRVLEIGSSIINSGTIDMTLGGEIRFNEIKLGLFQNTGSFIPGIGTIVFKTSANISGNATTFHHLTINSGVLTLPSSNLQLPTIEGVFTINGGSLFQANQLGPLYASGSSLVYSSGSVFIRGIEWNSSGVAMLNSPGAPRIVYVDNNTHLYLEESPFVQPAFSSASLQLNGDLILRKGKLINHMNRVLEIKGNIQLGINTASLSELIMNSDLYLHGNFIKYYNSSFSFLNGAKLFLTGSSYATIEEREFPDESNPNNFVFPKLIISKNADIFLESSIRVIDSLAFNLGIIVSSSDHYLLVDSNCAVSGGNIVSFVDGPMKKVTSNLGSGSNDFEFKIGKVLPSAEYKPVWITDIQPNGNTTFTAEYFPTSTTAMPTFSGSIFVDPNLTGIWANEWWHIDRSGSGKARVGIYYMPVGASSWEPTAPCSECNVGVVHYNSGSSSWEFTKTSGNFNTATPPYFEAILNTLTSLVYTDVETDFSPFTIGFSFPSVLPIKLTNFTTQLQNGHGYIKWNVSDISTLKNFELEHSIDGVRFQPLATVAAGENNAYQYIDKDLSSGIHYYRLKIFEKNGRYNYSRIEWIQVGTDKTIISGLMQNPVGGGQAIVKVYSAATQTADAMVIDRSGRVMLSQRLTLHNGNNQVNISVLPLNPGTYFLKLRTKDGVEKVMPFLK